MSKWWYIQRNKKKGPVSEEEILSLLLKRKINESTKLWKEGMDTWQFLSEIDELNSLKSQLPPEIPSKPKNTSDPYKTAGPWARFFARIFDLWWQLLLLSLITGFIIGRYFPEYASLYDDPSKSQLLTLALFPAALLLDAIIYRVCGNTPGKALLGVKVTRTNSNNLPLSSVIGRNLELWASGLALALPLINLITMGRQYYRLRRGKPASYDEGSDIVVRQDSLKWYRYFIFVIAFICLLSILVFLNIAATLK